MKTKRIEFLASLCSDYTTVYDLCCDHGKIGKILLNQKKYVHFIDINKEIIDKLKDQNLDNCSIKAMSILDIRSIEQNAALIVAGIGSKLASDFLAHITAKIDHTNTIIISSQGSMNLLLDSINKNKFTRVDEYIIEDRGRFYEIYILKKLQDFTVNRMMNKHLDDPKFKSYKDKQIKHLKNKEE
ncbi:MAG: tRNA (adenine(22)-N(1))-methyltransferase TrmK [Bacteriovoracaceae bacterium]|nr:tRNA (adenine(22)-N(1))-methyltransferase TrmK [Bacteriovoracaceae bacterium]